MCGICGELRLDGAEPDLGLLSRMLSKLARRGPDHEACFSDGPIVFGHRRLSIIDLTDRSNQPMVDRDLGLTLVFNGAIYNYRELRKELIRRGHRFFSDGDTEVILKAYAEWGERCVERLVGMFAFAVWDIRRRVLFLARDRLGIKPLYYTRCGGNCIRFASNVQALLEGDVNTEIDPVGLHNQLTLHAVIPAPRTILKGVRKLAPGHTLTIDAKGGERVRRYWHLSAQRPAETLSEAEWTERVHEALRLAVRRRRDIADVPVGVLLSGGLDSSLLVALLAEEGGIDNLLTFSVGFEDQPEEKGSEFEYSDLVVERYPTRHHKYLIPNDQVIERLPEAVGCMAEPMVGQDAVAFFLLSERVSREVKVVQSGQGADEVFGGYFWYPRMAAETGSDLDRFRKHYFDRDHAEFLESVNPVYHGADHTAQIIEALLEEPGAEEYLDKVLRMDATTLIVDDPVKRVDNMTMAFGLEARVPFLDHELVELAMQLPPQLKLGSDGKHVLKTIARKLLPAGVIDRPKGYFPVPALKFVRGDFLAFMRDVLTSRASRERGIFQPAYLEKLLAEPEAHMTRLNGSKLWHAALLELWMQQNVDQSPAVNA